MAATAKQWKYFREWIKWRKADPEAVDAYDHVEKAVKDIICAETGLSKARVLYFPVMEEIEFSGMCSVREAEKRLKELIADGKEEMEEEKNEELWTKQLKEMDQEFLKKHIHNIIYWGLDKLNK